MWYVYVVKSISTKFKYVGSTNDIGRRVEEHNSGKCRAMRPFRPYELIAYVAVENKTKARVLEKYFKTGSGGVFLQKRIL